MIWWISLLWFRWLTMVAWCIGALIMIYIFYTSHETSENPWIWLPLFIP